MQFYNINVIIVILKPSYYSRGAVSADVQPIGRRGVHLFTLLQAPGRAQQVEGGAAGEAEGRGGQGSGRPPLLPRRSAPTDLQEGGVYQPFIWFRFKANTFVGEIGIVLEFEWTLNLEFSWLGRLWQILYL